MRVPSNPFDSAASIANSSYLAVRDEELLAVRASAQPVEPLALMVHEAFRSWVLNPGFPCLGAKAAINQGAYRFGLYREMGRPDVTAGLARDLFWYTRDQEAWDNTYATFVAIFREPGGIDENAFDARMWEQLQLLHDLDAPLHPWAPGVSADPQNPTFSFSFAGEAFFIVALHGSSSRYARRFAWPTLVFNRHDQFERLREEGNMDSMQEAIRARDIEIQGSLNPNLADFGVESEARQYSGRHAEAAWTCPLHVRDR